MATSHATPTPPHPRPGDGDETGYGQVPQDRADGAQELPTGYSLLAAWGFRPWVALYTAAAVTFVLGLIVLIWPGATLLVLALLFGVYLVISGVLSLIEGFSEQRADGGMRIAYVVLGVLGILLGLFCLRRIDVTVLLLAFMLSMFWITRGIVDLSIATSHRSQQRGLRAFTGLLSLVAGVLVLFWPGISLTTLLVFAGAWLLIHGMTLGYLGYQLHRVAR